VNRPFDEPNHRFQSPAAENPSRTRFSPPNRPWQRENRSFDEPDIPNQRFHSPAAENPSRTRFPPPNRPWQRENRPFDEPDSNHRFNDDVYPPAAENPSIKFTKTRSPPPNRPVFSDQTPWQRKNRTPPPFDELDANHHFHQDVKPRIRSPPQQLTTFSNLSYYQRKHKTPPPFDKLDIPTQDVIPPSAGLSGSAPVAIGEVSDRKPVREKELSTELFRVAHNTSYKLLRDMAFSKTVVEGAEGGRILKAMVEHHQARAVATSEPKISDTEDFAFSDDAFQGESFAPGTFVESRRFVFTF
jgi:hypothetical protein